MAAQYSILVDVELQTKQIQEQLKQVKGAKIDIDTSSVKKASQDIEDLGLTFNVANQMFQTSIDLINGFVDQVRELDDSIVDFRKVSDLSGKSLDDYVQKLSKMGTEVARTGKPNRSEPVCTNGKCA